MALTKIKKSQLDALSIINSDIDASAAIASSKLADGANFVKRMDLLLLQQINLLEEIK